MKRSSISIVIVTKDRPEELIRAIESIENSTIQPLEVIIVVNGSEKKPQIPKGKNQMNVIFINLPYNMGAAEGRNRGGIVARGEYILFMDDDAWLDKNCIDELISFASTNKNIGILQPKILTADSGTPPTLQGIAHDINLTTGRLTGVGIGEKDLGQYKLNKQIAFAGCVWMTSRFCFEQLAGYDPRFYIPYEDSDYSIRAHKAGFEVWYVSNAIVWHPQTKKTFINKYTTFIGITNPSRAYYVSRNKLLFLSKHSSTSSLILYLLLFMPLYSLIHSIFILTSRRLDILILYYRGLLNGLNFIWIELIKRLKIMLLAWVEPPVWLIDKRTRSILDIGCGDAVPMRMIKSRRNITWSVGIDLFLPYLYQDKMYSTHNRFLTQDVMKIKLEKDSFDTVICFQLIEHLKKHDALKLISKLEEISKNQVILATPIGEMYHPPVDNNSLQLHQSYFTDTELRQMGYRTYKYGWKWLLGEEGLAHKVGNLHLRRLIYFFTILLTPFMYLFGNYHVYAVKRK